MEPNQIWIKRWFFSLQFPILSCICSNSWHLFFFFKSNVNANIFKNVTDCPMNIGGTRVLILTLVPPPFLWFVLLFPNVKKVWLNMYMDTPCRKVKNLNPLDKIENLFSASTGTSVLEVLGTGRHLCCWRWGDTSPHMLTLIPTGLGLWSQLLYWGDIHYTSLSN